MKMCGWRKLKLFWMFTMNVIFLGVGLLFLGFGAWYSLQELPKCAMVVATNTISSSLTRTMSNTNQVILVTCGCLLLVTGTFGIIYSACMPKVRVVGQMYQVLIAICSAFQLALFVLAVVTRNESLSDLEQTMTFEVQYEYGAHNNNTAFTTAQFDRAWDYIQASLQCCGSYNYTSWEDSHFSTRTHLPVPWSCCVLQNTDPPYSISDVANLGACKNEAAGFTTNFTYLHTQGCAEPVKEKLGYYGEIIGILIVVLYVEKIVGVLMMMCHTDVGVVV